MSAFSPSWLRVDRALYGELLRLAWPITVSMLSFTFMTVVDTAFMGRLGPAALAGVGLGGVALFTTLCFGFGLLRAVKVLSSQALGAGERRQVPSIVGAGLVVALTLSVAFIGVGLCVASVLPRFAASSAAGVLAHDYMTIRLCGAPFALVACALREARYGVEDAKSAMRAAVISNVLHAPLNYCLMFTFGLGVAGAAWSTVLAQGLEVTLLALAQRRDGFGLRRFTSRELGRILHVGVPTGIEFLLAVSAFSALVVLIARMGETDLAAHQVALQITHVSFMPALAVGEAASVLSGKAVGASDDARVRTVARAAYVVAGAYAALCAVLSLTLAEPILRAFTTDAGVVRIGARLLYCSALFQVFDAGAIVSRCVLRGTGDVRVPALVGVACAWLFVPSLTFLLGIGQGLGAVGGWLALTADIVASCALLGYRLNSGAWRRAAAASRARLAMPQALAAP